MRKKRSPFISPSLREYRKARKQSHKKRNALIGLAGAVTTVVISGAISKGRDSK